MFSSTPAESDDALMLRFQEETDYAAFETLFRRHKDSLFRFLVRLMGDSVTAEDASQHTWLKVVEVARRGTYARRPDAGFRTWVFTLARNHVVDEYKRKFAAARTVALSDELREQSLQASAASAQEAMDVSEAAAALDLTQHLDSALQELPLAQREVISLWAIGEDPASIATITGTPRDTVFSRKKYAMAKLRAALEKRMAADETACRLANDRRLAAH